jgi:hypothetical protein
MPTRKETVGGGVVTVVDYAAGVLELKGVVEKLAQHGAKFSKLHNRVAELERLVGRAVAGKPWEDADESTD